MFSNRFSIEEESGTYKSLSQEVTGKSGNPFEDREPGAGLQYEECNNLLQEEADDNRWPDRGII